MNNPFSLEGKHILVTGASSGIGKATAIECSKMGATLTICGRNKERLNETLSLLTGEEHTLHIGDLNDADTIKELVRDSAAYDGIVLCAGQMKTVPFKFAAPEQFHDMFVTNFFSPIELLRQLVKSKKVNKNGSIVIISSIGGIKGFPVGNSIYGASKAALNSMVISCAKELAPRIRINSICPGMVETPLIYGGSYSQEDMEKNVAEYALKRYGKPEDIAYGAIYLLSEAATWITGTSLFIDVGCKL